MHISVEGPQLVGMNKRFVASRDWVFDNVVVTLKRLKVLEHDCTYRPWNSKTRHIMQFEIRRDRTCVHFILHEDFFGSSVQKSGIFQKCTKKCCFVIIFKYCVETYLIYPK